MILINVETHTSNGLVIPTGSLLNVTPHFMDYVENGITKYNISFDVTIFKDMNAYLSNKILVRDTILEYNIGYTAKNVDIQTLSSVSSLIGILKDHIENGDDIYPGIGIGNASIVFPPVS